MKLSKNTILKILWYEQTKSFSLLLGFVPLPNLG
jgi:hypothetical protein